MLSRHGCLQPPQRISARSSAHASDSLRSQTVSNLCPFCQSDVFTSSLHEKLTSVSPSSGAIVETYGRSLKGLHDSVMMDCQWCVNLTTGMLTASHLDRAYEDWNGSHSDGSSMFDDRSMDDSIDGTQQNESCDVHEDEQSERGHIGSEELYGNLTDEQDDLNVFSSLTLSDLEKHSGFMTVRMEFKSSTSLKSFDMLYATISIIWEGLELDSNSSLQNMANGTAVELEFEIFGSERSKIFAFRKRTQDLASEQTIDQALKWMGECKQHVPCSIYSREAEESSSTQLTRFRSPRYLIDLDSLKRPKIIDHASLPDRAKYVALSYVWGGLQTYVLTKETLAEKSALLDVNSIPKTIIEAMDVTRKLGYSYLWVDALCIPQETLEHDGSETMNMGTIYSCSEVTIIAANSTSSTDGFLKIADPPSYFIQPFETALFNRDGGVEDFSLGYRSFYKPLSDPINHRAWTLQERLMSTRCLIFSYDGLKWVCTTCERNTSGPPGGPPMFPKMIPKRTVLTGPADHKTLRQAWLEVRSEYTQRRLTFDSDKLPAISAVALKIFQDSGWTYLAGMWEEYLFVDLHWHRDPQNLEMNPLLPRPNYRAPSWSWASINGHVVDADDDGDPREAHNFTILSCEVEHSTSVQHSSFSQSRNLSSKEAFHFGSVKSEMLVVEASTIQLGWKWAEMSGDITDIYLLDLSDSSNPNVICGEATFDCDETEVEKVPLLHCMAMSILNYDNRRLLPVEGLLLVPAGCTDQFRRVGFFRIYNSLMYDSIEAEVIQIV